MREICVTKKCHIQIGHKNLCRWWSENMEEWQSPKAVSPQKHRNKTNKKPSTNCISGAWSPTASARLAARIGIGIGIPGRRDSRPTRMADRPGVQPPPDSPRYAVHDQSAAGSWTPRRLRNAAYGTRAFCCVLGRINPHSSFSDLGVPRVDLEVSTLRRPFTHPLTRPDLFPGRCRNFH